MSSCPICKAATVQRTNKTTGAAFTGCSAFPKCRWSAKAPHQICTNAEGVRDMADQERWAEDPDGGDERDPMLESYGDFHDY